MGADAFSVLKVGRYKSVSDALAEAVKEAQHEHGHGGYTGTIAEKCGSKLERVDVPPNSNPLEYFEANEGELIDACDKWGAVRYIEVTNPEELKRLAATHGFKTARNVKAYLFFGLASS